MSSMMLLLLMFTLLIFTEGTFGGMLGVVYVSKSKGQAEGESCGSKVKPCKTLQLGFDRLAPNGLIYVDGDKTEKDPYTCKLYRSPFQIQKGFSMFSYINSIASISCPHGIDIKNPKTKSNIQMNVSFTGVSFVESNFLWIKPGIVVTLKSVSFKNTVLLLKDASAIIHDCGFRKSSPAIKIWISNSRLKSVNLKVKGALFKENCGGIEITQSRRAKGCNRKVILNLQDVLFQGNSILMDLKPMDRERGLVYVKGSTNCFCDDMSFFSTWKNITVIENRAVLKRCNNSTKVKQKECCWRRKEKPDSLTTSIFVVYACRNHLKFSKVKSRNNKNTRFLASKSWYNNISIEDSSYNGHWVDSPGGVMRIKGRGMFVNVSISDSVFFNNSGALGGVLQIDGDKDKDVVLNMNNVRLLYSHGSSFGCIISVANFSKDRKSSLTRVANVTANFNSLLVNQTQFSYGENRTKGKNKYSAFCFAASDLLQISIKNSLFYRNMVPALILKQRSTYSFTPSSGVEVKLEKTDFIENTCPHDNAIPTVVVDPFAKKSNLTFLKTRFLKNAGIAVIAKKVIQVKARNLVCSRNSGNCMLLESKYWPKDFSSVSSTLIIQNSRFTHNLNSPIKFRHSKPKFLDVQIKNTIFHGNRYRASLDVEIGLKNRNNSLLSGKLTIDRSSFTSNSVNFASTHVLTCILLVPSKAKFTILIRKTVFKDNFQNSKGNTPGVSSVFFFYMSQDFEFQRSDNKRNRGRCRKFPRFKYNRRVSFQDVIFENNTGSSSMLHINNGANWFYRCLFKNNFARYPKAGAHVLIEEGTARVQFFNTQFEQANVPIPHKAEKDKKPCKDPESSLLSFIYTEARGALLVKNTSFMLNASERRSEMFIIQNGRFVHFDSESSLRCPVGSFMKLENSSHMVRPMFTRDHCRLNITRMRFVCRMCPVSTYSLERGAFRGLTNKTHIDCLDCPFGSQCDWNIRSKNNFWGYLTSTYPPRLRFTSCPDNYCRIPGPNASTSVYNRCSGNRTGVMCGACKEGFTESIFNHKCRPINECRDSWFWAIAGLYSVIMATYIVSKPRFFAQLAKGITWFRSKKISTPKTGEATAKYVRGEHCGRAYLKIIFYFYQVADLLMLDSSSEIMQQEQVFIVILMSLYNFQVDMADSSFGCPFPGLTAVTKELFRCLQVFGVMLFIVVFYFLHWFLWAIRKRPRPHFAPYLAAIIEVLLLGYERLGHTSFNLLGCAPLKINGHVVWKMFIDGNITCWVHWWQYVMVAYNIVFVIPFMLVLLVGTRKLQRREMGPFRFLAACFVPFPFLTYWMLVRLSHIYNDKGPDHATPEDRHQQYRKDFLDVIQGPFRPPNSQSKGALYWESILIGRRLVLLSLHSLVATPMLRLLSMTVVCLVILIHDVVVQPFKDKNTNVLAAILLSVHVVLGIINVVKASLINVGVAPKGPPQAQIHALQLLEMALLGALPCVFFLLVAACVISQTIRVILKVGLYLSTTICLKRGTPCSRHIPQESTNYLDESYRPLLNPLIK